MPDFLTLGSTFRRARIGAGSIAFASGASSAPLELPNSLLAKGVTLRLSGNLVVGTATATLFSEAPLGLIKALTIVGDGRRFLVNSPARDLFRLSHFTWGKQPELVAPLATVGTRPFSATIRIDHETLRAMNPVETLFDPRLFKKVTLGVQWGAVTDIATAGGGGGTIAISSCSLDVMVDQTSEGVGQILFDRTIAPDEYTITSTNANFPIKVPQNGLLAGILIRTDRDAGDGTGPIPVNDLINTVSLKSDTTIAHYDRVAWNTLRADNLLEFQLDNPVAPTKLIDGYAFIPLMEHGMISSALNTNALNQLQLVLDVTNTSGTQVVHLTYVFLEPRRAVAASVASA